MNGDVFDGELSAVIESGEMRLMNGNRYIVLTDETWGTLSGELQAGVTGYKFATATSTDLTNGTVGGHNILASNFKIAQPQSVSGEPVEIVAITNAVPAVEYEVRVAVVAGNSYLTVGANTTADAAEYTATVNDTDQDGKFTTAGETADNTWVRFGAGNKVNYADFYDKVLNITRVSVDGGAVYAMNPKAERGQAQFIPVAQIALGQPEGQWIYDGGANFINRESNHVWAINNLRYVEGETNVYTDGSYNYTIAVVGTPGDYGYNGYFAGENGEAYTPEQLKVKTFRIGTPLASTSDTVYMTLGKDDQIAWTADATDAVEFRFTQVVGTEDYALVKHITKYHGLKEGKVVEKEDTLNLYRYNITDLTGKALYFDGTNNRYQLKELGARENPINIVLKAKDNNCYNIMKQVATTFTTMSSLRTTCS